MLFWPLNPAIKYRAKRKSNMQIFLLLHHLFCFCSDYFVRISLVILKYRKGNLLCEHIRVCLDNFAWWFDEWQLFIRKKFIQWFLAPERKTKHPIFKYRWSRWWNRNYGNELHRIFSFLGNYSGRNLRFIEWNKLILL